MRDDWDAPAQHDQPDDGKPAEHRRREIVLGLALAAIIGAATIGVVVTSGDSNTIRISDDAIAGAEAAAAAADIIAATENADGSIDVDLAGITDPDPDSNDGAIARADGGCTIGSRSLQFGAQGDGVECLQEAMADAGLFDAAVTGEFDQATFEAVESFQVAEDLFVDGVVGRETAIALNIWPDEESLVVRTPEPEPGATDLWGVELSPVASAGDDAPPLPANSGTGYRVVYDRAGQRAWAVDDDERIIRSWLVSGSTYSNELPGTHYVYSRSEVSTAWNGKAYLPLMVRWLKTQRGNIGFHGIPTKVSTGEAYQGTEELGTRLSGGCQRQHNTDAQFLWGFADIGTKVVVT
jgi:hypothetical protein